MNSDSGRALIMHVKTVEIVNSVKGDVMIQVEEEWDKGSQGRIV